MKPDPFMNKNLTALPVYNEVETVHAVLDQVVGYSQHVLVIDDGSTDGTAEALLQRDDVTVITHQTNRGYGAALMTAFQFAIEHQFDSIVSIDCDGQHEPQRIQDLVDRLYGCDADIVSGSRYLKRFDLNSEPPAQRRWINQQVTAEINERLSLNLTDAFCGFKAYRVCKLPNLHLTETGYAMPLELWVQAACQKLKIIEMAVPLIYLDENRSFGGDLDDGGTRLNYYNQVLQASIARARQASGGCPEISTRELTG